MWMCKVLDKAVRLYGLLQYFVGGYNIVTRHILLLLRQMHRSTVYPYKTQYKEREIQKREDRNTKIFCHDVETRE